MSTCEWGRRCSTRGLTAFNASVSETGAPVPTVDTVVTLDVVERDLTGDGVAEILSLTGVGATIDSLDVTFRIQSSGQTIHTETWPMTRTVGFDAGRRTLSATEHHARLKEFGSWFLENPSS
jgi:hypothetical protein